MIINDLATKLLCINCNASGLDITQGICSCGKCGKKYKIEEGKVFFSSPPIDARVLKEGKKKQRQWGRLRSLAYEYLKKNLETEDRRKSLCDLGVGTSINSPLTSRFSEFVGVDFLPYETVSAVADINEPLPFRDNSFDIILLSEVLEHIFEPKGLVKEIGRVLKPGGFLIGATPFLHPVHYHPYDFYRYTPFEYGRFFKEAGLNKYEIVPVGSAADVYKTYQSRYFSSLLKLNSSGVRGLLKSLLVRLIRKLYRISSLITRRYDEKLTVDKDAPLGYCFKAYKNKA